MPRIYRIQRQGGAYYLCLPTFLVTEEMLEHGVTIEVLKYDKTELIMKVTLAYGEHIKNNKTNRENASESRAASSILKTD